MVTSEAGGAGAAARADVDDEDAVSGTGVGGRTSGDAPSLFSAPDERLAAEAGEGALAGGDVATDAGVRASGGGGTGTVTATADVAERAAAVAAALTAAENEAAKCRPKRERWRDGAAEGAAMAWDAGASGGPATAFTSEAAGGTAAGAVAETATDRAATDAGARKAGAAEAAEAARAAGAFTDRDDESVVDTLALDEVTVSAGDGTDGSGAAADCVNWVGAIKRAGARATETCEAERYDAGEPLPPLDNAPA